jgi:hypothetical protein
MVVVPVSGVVFGLSRKTTPLVPIPSKIGGSVSHAYAFVSNSQHSHVHQGRCPDQMTGGVE